MLASNPTLPGSICAQSEQFIISRVGKGGLDSERFGIRPSGKMEVRNIAVVLNNQGVDHLIKSNKDMPHCSDAMMNNMKTGANDYNHCSINSFQNSNRVTPTTIHPENIDRAMTSFERALSLVLRSTEVYRKDGGLKYFETDPHGMIQYENESIERELTSSLDLQETGVIVNGTDDESFIHWKAVKIGNYGVMKTEDASSFTDESKHDGTDYQHLSTSIFHCMVIIYNLGLCYQYKGIQTASKSLLQAAVDHYMQAYELGTRFRLQHIDQYTLLMTTMNNMATTYSFLNETAKRDVCNNYLLSTLMLLTTSEEGQENHRAAVHCNDRMSLARQTTYQRFLSNVMYLISEDNVAPAA